MSEHITRAEFYEELSKFTRWVNGIHADFRHRLRRIEGNEEYVMTTLGDDIGQFEGMVSQLESLLVAQDQHIQELTAQDATDSAAAAAAAPNAQDLADGHQAMSSVLQQMRDFLATRSPDQPAPEIVPPAPGTTTADGTGADGGAGMAADQPAATDAPIPGGQAAVVDPNAPEGTVAPATGAPAGVTDATAGPGQGDSNPPTIVSPDQAAAPVVDTSGAATDGSTATTDSSAAPAADGTSTSSTDTTGSAGA